MAVGGDPVVDAPGERSDERRVEGTPGNAPATAGAAQHGTGRRFPTMQGAVVVHPIGGRLYVANRQAQRGEIVDRLPGHDLGARGQVSARPVSALVADPTVAVEDQHGVTPASVGGGGGLLV